MKVVVDATVGMNDWVSVEREKNWNKDGNWGTPYWSAAGCESVLPALIECVLPDRYDLNQPSASASVINIKSVQENPEG